MSTPGELLEALGREARARFTGGGDGGTRVYRGRSVEELVPQIQRELGADAIIVRRREGLTGGMLGFFQHAYVEIEAMPGAPGIDVYDEGHDPQPVHPDSSQLPEHALEAQHGEPAAAYVPPAPAPPAPGSTATAPEPGPPALPAPPQMAEPSPSSAFAVPPRATPAPPPAVQPPPRFPPAYAQPPLQPPPAPPADAGSAYVTAHLAALARAGRPRAAPRASAPETPETSTARGRPVADLQELGSHEPPEPFTPTVIARRASAPPAADERRDVAPGSQGRARAGVSRSLQRYGIGEELAGELIEGASAHALALEPRAGLAQAVRATLAQRIPVAPPLPTQGAAIMIVGAGGTGKTTCCAALLAAYRQSSSLPASCATVTREGERGELRMLLSPHLMKPSAAHAQRTLRALRRVRSEGVAIIDTPDLSPADRAGVRELARLVSELEPERVVVALPATLGATAAAQLLQALRPLGANSVAVTHAEETDQIGVAVEAACRFGLAPEYMLERARAGGWRLRRIDPTGLAERLLA